MGIETRRASMTDVAHLVRIRLMANGGFNEALYGNLGQPVEEIIETELSEPGLTDYYQNYWVALSRDEIVGGLSAYPWDDLENDLRNPLVPPERYALEKPFTELSAPGTYYIHALSVYPEFTRRGIGSILLALARDQAIERNFIELSLFVFKQNVGALTLYENHGYRVVGHRPIVPHPKIIYSGEVLLMTCPV
jgi:ribosomal protein S18 acetylase RimI-like enzyme